MVIDNSNLGRSLLTHLECTSCGATYPSDRLMTTCPACAKVLFARYDLDAAASQMTPDVAGSAPMGHAAVRGDPPHPGAPVGAVARRGRNSAA